MINENSFTVLCRIRNFTFKRVYTDCPAPLRLIPTIHFSFTLYLQGFTTMTGRWQSRTWRWVQCPWKPSWPRPTWWRTCSILGSSASSPWSPRSQSTLSRSTWKTVGWNAALRRDEECLAFVLLRLCFPYWVQVCPSTPQTNIAFTHQRQAGCAWSGAKEIRRICERRVADVQDQTRWFIRPQVRARVSTKSLTCLTSLALLWVIVFSCVAPSCI